AVAPDGVLRVYLDPLAAGARDACAHAAVMLLERFEPAADGEAAAVELRDRLPEHLLDEVLRDLLPRLGDELRAAGKQPEDALEARDLDAEQVRAEDDLLRPLDLQRRDLADAVGDAPPAEVLHRPRVRRLRPGPAPRDLVARLDDDAVDSPRAELHRHGQA